MDNQYIHQFLSYIAVKLTSQETRGEKLSAAGACIPALFTTI